MKQEFNGPVEGGVAGNDVIHQDAPTISIQTVSGGTNIIGNQGGVVVQLYGDFFRYLDMDEAELQHQMEMLSTRKRNAYAAFIRHRTVPWFGASMFIVITCFIAGFWWPDSMPLGLVTLAFLGLAFIPSLLWMLWERRPLHDGLQLLCSQIKTVEACLAIRSVKK